MSIKMKSTAAKHSQDASDMMMSVINRIMDKVEMIPLAGCWIFTGALNDADYGIIGLGGGRKSGIDRVHRVMHRHFIGPIPRGFFVLHRCDVRPCCNPHHLFSGTNQDNVDDMVHKGRNSKPPRNSHDIGEYRYNAKLTADIVRAARIEFDAGVLGTTLAKKYEVSDATMYKACQRKSWRHVK